MAKKKDTKQLLFENMEKLNPDFKATLNEDAKRWHYEWGNGWNAIIMNSFGDRFTWRVWEENEAIPPIFSSDWADLKTFEDAEDDMFSEIRNRIGHTPKSQKNQNIEEIAPITQPTAGAQQTQQNASKTYQMIAPQLKMVNTVEKFAPAFKEWFQYLGYSPQAGNISITRVREDVINVMKQLGYK